MTLKSVSFTARYPPNAAGAGASSAAVDSSAGCSDSVSSAGCSASASSAASLGGEFVASHSVSKEADSSEKKGSLVAGMFDEDKASAAAGSFVPPTGFVSDPNDLMKPAIWNKGEYSRTIRLDD